MQTSDYTPTPSPRWSSTLKLIVGLSAVALLMGLVVTFHTILGPLLMAVIFTYLLYPLTGYFSQLTHLPWRTSANLVFLLVLATVIGILAISGVVIVQQVQSLGSVVETFANDLPGQLRELYSHPLQIGPLQIDPAQFGDINSISAQILGAVENVIGQAGALISSLVSGTASTIGWAFFILLISYFLLVDAKELPSVSVSLALAGYESDLLRLRYELGHIWNAFLRGQILIVTIVIIVYSVLMTGLGVRYALGIAILTGLARFVPYIGPLVTNLVIFLVAAFQGENYFGLHPLAFAGLAVGVSIITDQIFDNVVSPRIMGDTLGVHPAAVFVAAIIAANLIGFVGLLLAAPVLATLSLVGRYTLRKMLDLNPFPERETRPQASEMFWLRRIWRRVGVWWRTSQGRSS